MEKAHLIQYYTIKYKTDGPWKTLNKGQIRPEETTYLGETLLLFFFPLVDRSNYYDKASYEHRTGVQHRVRVIPKHSWTNITYRTDFREYGFHAISHLTRTPTVKNLVGGRTYYFQVFANSATNYGASDQVKFAVPARVKHKAITAGVVGGILFFLVAIILSICAVKICNKRKRRKQEKGMNAPWRYQRIVHRFARNSPGPVLLVVSSLYWLSQERQHSLREVSRN